MKLKDNENMIHIIHKENDEYWILSECFKVDMKNRSTTGKTLADFGPYKTVDGAIDSIKVFDSGVRIIDNSTPVSILESDSKLIEHHEQKKTKKSKSK